MSLRVYKFILKPQREVSFVGTHYFPVEIDPNLSPYTTVLATIWDGDQMVGQVNQTEILAWWSEPHQDQAPQPRSAHERDLIAANSQMPAEAMESSMQARKS
jgi:hypothetical protein